MITLAIDNTAAEMEASEARRWDLTQCATALIRLAHEELKSPEVARALLAGADVLLEEIARLPTEKTVPRDVAKSSGCAEQRVGGFPGPRKMGSRDGVSSRSLRLDEHQDDPSLGTGEGER